MTSFTGPKNFKIETEYYVKIPVVTTPTGVLIHQVFEEQNRKVLFKKSHGNYIKIDLSNVILLERKSTMDLFCNPKLFGKIYNTKKQIAFRAMEAIWSSLTRHM